jgi:uncharacterized protein YndB with AHSA1/START domain
MIQDILIAALVIVVVFVIFIALQPAQFRVTRTGIISAPPAAVFAQVNDLHMWEGWSPWAKLDPAAKKSHEGPAAGVGAVYRWAGNRKVGEGSMTIIESRPAELIRFKLEFLKPFKGTNTAEFTFQPEGNQTAVTWSLSGKNSFTSKAMGFIVNSDKRIGSQFEQGLADLKFMVEAVGRR